MSGTQPRVIIYSRISKDKAADEHGVVNQLAACEKHAASRGWMVVRRLCDNDLSASNGVHRPGYEEALRLIAARQADILLCWKIDRFVRRVRDLEDVIELFERAGAKLASVDGDLDLSSSSGRLVGRMLAVVAKGEMESKGARQRLAADSAARDGKRWTGCPRPFGFDEDRVTPHPVEGAAVAAACAAIVGGSTVSSVAREWERLGLRPPQAPFGPLREHPWSRVSVTTILRNPRIAGLNAMPRRADPADDFEADERKRPRRLPVEITGRGQWTPLVSEETWRAAAAILADPGRKHAQGVRTMLGGLATCACGNTAIGSVSHLGQHIYRCDPAARNGRKGPHVTRAAAVADLYVQDAVIGRLSRPDAAQMLAAPKRVDVTRLREQAASIRSNLEQMGGDCAEGLISRAQMLAGTKRANTRLAEIGAQLAEAGSDSVLTPLVAAENAATAWADLDLASQRSVIDALMAVRLLPAGQGARHFDPATVVITWKHDLTL
jgi:site-specific DNA recombinase